MIEDNWPELSYDSAKETYETIHMWTQIVGKIKLAKMPWINHSWHVSLAVTPTGLTTGVLPDKNRPFEINIDFLRNELQLRTNKGDERSFSLKELSVAGCYNKLLQALRELSIEVKINPIPSEIAEAVPFPKNNLAVYDAEMAAKFHQALLSVNAVFQEFRSRFRGKSSPVHFFWGSFDLAESRFSGRPAPEHPGGIPNLPDRVAREAYSHEVSSCGFWPGNEMLPYAAFYSYIYPEPAGYKEAAVKPDAAFYHQELGEFILPYESVRKANDPAEYLLSFLQSTYEAAADLAQWNRKELESR